MRGYLFRRRRYPLIFVLLFIIISLQYILRDRAGDSQRGEIRGDKAIVVAVHDGDTVTLKIGDQKGWWRGKSGEATVRARLIGIDAPEMGQLPWGKKAKEHLERLIKKGGGEVTVVRIETDIQRFDKYNRWLVYLFTEDGRFINEEMLRDGYAVLLTIPPNVKYVDRLVEAQRMAKAQRLGIWGKGGLKEMPIEYKEKHR